MSEKSGKKLIARNTITLYVRMLVVMGVSFFTSRIVLSALGVDDYGIYDTVAGIVALISFINADLSTGSARYLTFEIGRGDSGRLHKTFCATLNIHMGIALIIVLLAETIGLWFLKNKLSIPAERMHAAEWVYQICIIGAVITMIQIPYTASIIAHEKMSVYAKVSIVEVCLKLGMVCMLSLTGADKLILYALLICVQQALIAAYYQYYCKRKYEETHYELLFDKEVLRNVLGFSGWTILASLTMALNDHGAKLITNVFFGPVVVTALSVALLVNYGAKQFVSSFRTAVNPQVVKRLAVDDREGSQRLALQSSTYSFFILFILALPIFLLSEPLLQLWLGQVPAYSVMLLRIIMVQSLFCVFDTSFYAALSAHGRLKESAILSLTLSLLALGLTYILFKRGLGPQTLFWCQVGMNALLALVVKPILLNRIAHYSYGSIFAVYMPCLWVAAVSVPIVYCADAYMAAHTTLVIHFILTVMVSVMVIGAAVWFVGLNSETRDTVKSYLKSHYLNRSSR